MKRQLFNLGLTVLMSVATVSVGQAARRKIPKAPPQEQPEQRLPAKFQGARPEPIGVVREAVSQLRIKFPEEMVKSAKTEVFKVTCLPAIEGFSGWADNNSIWTYDFKMKEETGSPRLTGGSKCDITQVADVNSSNGKTWKAGTIKYSVVIDGPNVTLVTPATGFKGSLRDADPVVLITFDGPVDADRFFKDQNGYINYLSSNAPSEKMSLVSVPKDQAEKIFELFKSQDYLDVKFKDRTWLLATIKQNLIPGSQVNLTIQNQTSADNPSVHAAQKFAKEFSVRSQFEAEISCANPSAKNGNCLPASPISVNFNGQVKWTDIKDAYIEYIPYKSADQKVVRSFAEIEKGRTIGMMDRFFYDIGRYFPFLARFNDTVLDSIEFNVNIEPQTQAKIVLPTGLKDTDGRLLSNAIAEFHIRIGSLDEMIHTPQLFSVFEKTVPNLFLPVNVVNLNQKLTIRKSGSDAKVWMPITDIASMIRIMRAYSGRGSYRDTPVYTSPLATLSIPSTTVDETLTGQKNRPTVLQFPFADAKAQPAQTLASGMYAIEISSPSLEAGSSNAKNGLYLNPNAVVAQVTDLTIHLKVGTKSNLAWVTRLSNAQPVPGAVVEVYNCNGDKVLGLTTDASGLASFPTKNWATECVAVGTDEDKYSSLKQADQFFVAAKEGNDVALIHSSWTSDGAFPMGAPGVGYFNSTVADNRVNYHAVIGVNLVKPGQQVPIEIFAKIPDAKGFHEVNPAELSKVARIVSSDEESVYYEFPLTWINGHAEMNWQVPSDSSVRLGRYTIEIGSESGTDRSATISSADIEVAEFKIPLMSGIIAFPNQELIRPDTIPVNSVVRYANGVGAKKLGVDISYYFTPTSITSRDLPNFVFGTGPETTVDSNDQVDDNKNLPTSSRPAVIQALQTGTDGSIVRDIAKEKTPDGRTVGEVLQSADRPQHLVVRVRYQDQMGEFQTLSQGKDVYNSGTYVGTLVKAGARNEANLQAAVIDTKQKNVTQFSDLEMKVIRVESRVIGEELFGGLIKNTLERELKPVRWNANCAPQDGVVVCPVGALKEGSYAFQVTSKTSHQSAHSLFKVDTEGRVYGQNDFYNSEDDEASKQLLLALNKATYKDGDKAVVSFAAPFKSCRALVTVERSEVLQAFIVPDACEKGHVEVPVEATLAPNAFVSVYAITGRADSTSLKLGELDLGRPTYRIGFANMKIGWDRFQSNVTVKTNKEKYAPGENVDVLVNVQAKEGQLKDGTVTLIAIEEKILELKKNDTYAVLESLMQLRTDSVQTVSALQRIETVTAQDIERSDKADRKGGDEGGDGSTKSDFKRKLFNALVVFKSGIPVQNGVAKYSFKTNDSLTRFRIFAVATDSGQKFGTGEAVYISEKDTQSYSNIPSVAHSGDSYDQNVTVQNNTGKAGKFRVEIVSVAKDKDGKVISTKTCKNEATIDSSSSQAIRVCRAEVSDDAATIANTIRIYDENGKLVDVMDPEAQIVVNSVPLAIHDSLVAQVQNGTFTKTIVKDVSALTGKGEIRVTTSKSLVSSALTQIGQRMDRNAFSNFFIESQFNQALLHSSEAKPDELKKVLETLVSSLDAKGFVKYHPRANRGDVWLTAAIINSLQQEPWSLKLLPTALKEKLQGAVSLVLTKSVDAQYIGETPMSWLNAQVIMGRAAFAFNDEELIASAKAIDKTINAELKRNPKAYGAPVEKWSNDELVERWLLSVYASPEEAKTASVYKQLTSPARLIHSGNMAQLVGHPYFSWFYSDETMETAKLLLGHSRLKGDRGLARNLAVGLVGANIKSWYNNSTMMTVAQGLKAFGRAYESEAVAGSALVSVVEQQKSATVDFDHVNSGGLTTDWTASKATIQITHAGKGDPWVSVQALSAVPLTAPRGQGLTIDKQLRNVSRDSGYQAGDVIEVTLKIQANAPLAHVAMLDPIPAGANILSEAYGEQDNGQKSYSGYKLYFSRLHQGVNEVKYQYQLNNPGSFKMPPTRAEGLYMPSIFAEAPNAVLKVN